MKTRARLVWKAFRKEPSYMMNKVMADAQEKLAKGRDATVEDKRRKKKKKDVREKKKAKKKKVAAVRAYEGGRRSRGRSLRYCLCCVFLCVPVCSCAS